MAIGGIIRGSKKITSNYTIVERDEIIYVDTSGGDITLTLARPTNDNIVYIKKVASANTVTILTEESKTIDGESSKTLSDNNSFLKLAYFVDGSENEFKIIGQSSTSLGYSSYVAKITQDCTFDMNESASYDCVEFEWSGSQYKRAFVGCTYHCG